MESLLFVLSSLGSPRLSLGEIALEDGVVEIFDASVATPPLKTRLEQIHASVRDVNVPVAIGRSHFELDGVVKGVTEDGRVHVAGWMDMATRDSSTTTELCSVDLVPLQRYLIRKGEAGIRGGRFDLDLHSEVREKRLQAPGKISVDFTLEGDIDSPEFSLDEALSTKLAYSLAETLGISFGGLVEGAGTIGLKSGHAAGEAAKGVGGAILDLFEEEPER